MQDINYEIEKRIDIIIKNEINLEKFNEFSVDFYLLTNKLLISLNKFLKIREIRNPKILQIKNIGQLIYESRDSENIKKLLKSNGINNIPQLSPQIAYYVVKKNKFTREDNWKNIIKVLKYGVNPSKVLTDNIEILTEEQKNMLKNDIMELLKLEKHEIEWVVNKIEELKSKDIGLYNKFKSAF